MMYSIETIILMINVKNKDIWSYILTNYSVTFSNIYRAWLLILFYWTWFSNVALQFSKSFISLFNNLATGCKITATPKMQNSTAMDRYLILFIYYVFNYWNIYW
jgi:hypothetical protein